MPIKKVRVFGFDLIACDGRCHKAWGMNGRPKIYFMEEGSPARSLVAGEEPRDEDDYVYVRDSALGVAPGPGQTIGLSEGGHLKPSATPLTDGNLMNKWCARECERSEAFKDGDTIVLRDLENPRPNYDRRRARPQQTA